MLQDGLLLADGAPAENFQIQYGSALPSTGLNPGELFYVQSGGAQGLYVYDGSTWKIAGGSSYPTQTGHAGQYLKTDGTTVSWSTASGAATLANHTVAYGDASNLLTSGGLEYWAANSPTLYVGGNTGASSSISTIKPLTGLNTVGLVISAGDYAGGAGGSAGNLTLKGGDPAGSGSNSGYGGSVNVTATSGVGIYGAAGNVNITAGNSPDTANSTPGGNIVLAAGNQTGGVGGYVGGSVKVVTGTGPVNGFFSVTTGGTERLRVLGTGALTFAGTAGTNGQVLTSTGAGSAPTWQAASAGFGGGTVSGATSFTSASPQITLGTASVGGGIAVTKTSAGSHGNGFTITGSQGGDSSGSDLHGGPITISGGTGASYPTGNGGTGGTLTLQGGDGGVGVSAGNKGPGGSVVIQGSSTALASGGSVSIIGGNGGSPGPVTITSGGAGSSGSSSANIAIAVGDARDGAGGSISIIAGLGANWGQSGLYGRDGGSVTISAGAGVGGTNAVLYNGNGGNMSLTAGNGAGSGNIGGILSLTAGTGQTPGYVTMVTGGAERLRVASTGAISFGGGGAVPTGYGTANQVLTSNGNAAPTWQAASGFSGGTVSGATFFTSSGTQLTLGNSSNPGLMSVPASSGAVNGIALTILGGSTANSFAGGTVTVQAGEGTTGTGGVLNLLGGAQTSASSAGAGGGAVNVIGGASQLGGTAGDVNIKGGFNVSGAAGGAIRLSTQVGSNSAYVERFAITRQGEWQLAGAGGTSGNVLTSTGAGSAPTWQAAGSGLPSQSGNSGKFLTTNGSSASWGTAGGTFNGGTITSPLTINAASGLIIGDDSNIGRIMGWTRAAGTTVGLQIFGSLGSTSGPGGAVSVFGGGGSGSSPGGDVTIQPGAGVTTAAGGNLFLYGGQGNGTGGGGDVTIQSGVTNSGGTGGNIILSSGQSGFGTTERLRILPNGAWSVGSSGTAYGASGNVLTSNGNAAPTWQAASGGGTPTVGGATFKVGNGSATPNAGAISLSTFPNYVSVQGTTGSFYELNTNGNTSAYFFSYASETRLASVAAAAPLTFHTNSAEKMRLTVNGGLSFSGASGYGTTGQVLTSAGDASPTWATPSAGTASTLANAVVIGTTVNTAQTLTGQAATSGGAVNPFTISAGSSSSGNPGLMTVKGANVSTSAIAGAVLIIGGTGGTGDGGTATLQGGSGGAASGAGANVIINGGAAAAGSGYGGGDIVFQTTPTSPPSLTERLRITGGGAWKLAGTTGTNGQVLTSNGSGVPAWAAPSAGAAAAGTLTGTTLASNVLASSLTSVGTLASLAVTGNITAADPTTGTQVTTKSYVDSLVAGLSWKNTALIATTANITLSGTQTIDGVAVVAGNRVLVKNQSTASQNGIYVVASGAWTRSTDANTAAELDGSAVYIMQGTANADTAWTEAATITTLGTDSVNFVQFAANTGPANAGTLTGTTLASNVVTSSLTSVGTLASLAVTGGITSATALHTSDAFGSQTKLATSAGYSGFQTNDQSAVRKLTMMSIGSAAAAAYGGSAGDAVINISGGSLVLSTNDSARFTIDTSGNIGINSAPSSQAKLTVTGGLFVNGPATLNAGQGVGLFSNEAPNLRAYVGDGTGYKWMFSQRAASVTTDLMTITDTGNVGIGTASPAYQLEIQGTGGNPMALTRFGAFSSSTSLSMAHSRGATVGSNVILQANDIFGSLLFNGANGTGYDTGAMIRGEVDGTPGASANMPGRLIFLTTPAGSGTPVERMRINNAGAVTFGQTGIPANVTAYTSQLTLLDGSYTSYIGRGSSFVSSGGAGDMAFRVDTGKFIWAFSGAGAALSLTSSGAITATGSYIATMGGMSNTSSNPGLMLKDTGTSSNRIMMAVNSTAAYLYSGGSTANPDLVIATNDGNIELARFTTGGAVLIGKASASYGTQGTVLGADGSISLSTTGAGGAAQVAFYRNGSSTAVGSISTTSTATTYNTSSDSRLKENVTPAGSFGSVIDSIAVVQFDWISSNEHQRAGVIAQDLHAIAPEAVKTGDADAEISDAWGVDYSKLVPMLIKEIQELRARVATLEAKP